MACDATVDAAALPGVDDGSAHEVSSGGAASAPNLDVDIAAMLNKALDAVQARQEAIFSRAFDLMSTTSRETDLALVQTRPNSVDPDREPRTACELESLNVHPTLDAPSPIPPADMSLLGALPFLSATGDTSALREACISTASASLSSNRSDPVHVQNERQSNPSSMEDLSPIYVSHPEFLLNASLSDNRRDFAEQLFSASSDERAQAVRPIPAPALVARSGDLDLSTYMELGTDSTRSVIQAASSTALRTDLLQSPGWGVNDASDLFSPWLPDVDHGTAPRHAYHHSDPATNEVVDRVNAVNSLFTAFDVRAPSPSFAPPCTITSPISMLSTGFVHSLADPPRTTLPRRTLTLEGTYVAESVPYASPPLPGNFEGEATITSPQIIIGRDTVLQVPQMASIGHGIQIFDMGVRSDMNQGYSEAGSENAALPVPDSLVQTTPNARASFEHSLRDSAETRTAVWPVVDGAEVLAPDEGMSDAEGSSRAPSVASDEAAIESDSTPPRYLQKRARTRDALSAAAPEKNEGIPADQPTKRARHNGDADVGGGSVFNESRAASPPERKKGDRSGADKRASETKKKGVGSGTRKGKGKGAKISPATKKMAPNSPRDKPPSQRRTRQAVLVPSDYFQRWTRGNPDPAGLATEFRKPPGTRY